jgi:CDP-glucose 4,6-dehydratase
MDPSFWQGRRVLVTGHTGFKGAWLASWLLAAGARLTGLSHAPSTEPNLYSLIGLDRRMTSRFADINDREALVELMEREQPEVVFHLAAQALVRASYRDPVATFSTNVTGVSTILDVVRRCASVRSVVVVTTDKCYENREWPWGYRELDALGGRDPYSASKACSELVARSMQLSFFAPYVRGGHPARIATVRAGNVIGGGDWSPDRLVPDIVRGCLGEAGTVQLRNPSSVRPWQHVLEPIAVYMLIAERLAQGEVGIDEAWNIGPDPEDSRAVINVAEALVKELGRGRIVVGEDPGAPHEATLLTLDCSKAKARLGWNPALNFEQAILMTAQWYGAWHRGEDMQAFTAQQIESYQHALDAGGRTDTLENLAS